MKLNDLLKLVEPEWHAAFLQFIETGGTDESFLAHLDQDEGCQQAVERAFTAQAASFEDFARALDATEPTPQERAANVSASMAVAFEGALELSPEERRDAAQKAAAALKAAIGPEQRKQLMSLVEDIEREVSAAG